MIDTEALRKKVIDLAIQGKLTQQLQEDGNAEDLYVQIQEEKVKLIKEGKIKEEKPLPPISEDEIPLEISDNWNWVRLGDIVSVSGGKRIPAGRKLTTEDTGHKYIRVSEMKNRSVVTDGLLYVPEDIYPIISRYIINKEDVYITVAGTIGKVGKIPEEIDGANLTENADKLVFAKLDQDWLIFCLSSSIIQKQIEKLTTQVAQPKLAIQRIQAFAIPLPPLAEQKRIVEKIEEILSQIDIIDTLQKQYESDCEILKGKIIDAGIRGKLTAQLPEDGNAEELYAQIQEEKAKLIKDGKIKKEKPLPPISEDEIPFEIPSNWKWMRIGDVVMNSLGGGTPSKSVPEYWNDGDIPWVSVKDFSSAESGYLCDTIDHITQDGLDNSASNLIDKDAIVICMRMALGKIVRLARPMAINQDLRAIWLYEYIDERYFVYFYSSLKIEGRGTTVSGIRKEELMNHLIPLPPLAEQKRIASEIKEALDSIS